MTLPVRPHVYAHRGASEEFPEQTRGAFLRALEIGADGLECDVHLSADGHLVCIHDPMVDRTSDGSGLVGQLSLAQLKALDWGSWREFNVPAGSTVPRDAGHAMVTLRELLALVVDAGRPVGLAVEAKRLTRSRGRLEAAIIAELDYFGLLDSPSKPVNRSRVDVQVISFSATILYQLSRQAPHLKLTLLDGQGWSRRWAGKIPPRATAYGPAMALVRKHPGVVAATHRRARKVHVWTVDDVVDVELCHTLGVDAITTNRPGPVLSLMTG